VGIEGVVMCTAIFGHVLFFYSFCHSAQLTNYCNTLINKMVGAEYSQWYTSVEISSAKSWLMSCRSRTCLSALFWFYSVCTCTNDKTTAHGWKMLKHLPVRELQQELKQTAQPIMRHTITQIVVC